MYTDKVTGAPKGEATVFYDEEQTIPYAIDCFNGKEFNGSVLKVVQATRPNFGPGRKSTAIKNSN